MGDRVRLQNQRSGVVLFKLNSTRMFLELKNELLHLSNAGMTGWLNALLKLKSLPGPSKRIFWSFIAQKGRCSLHKGVT
jgi:hypothetical protein